MAWSDTCCRKQLLPCFFLMQTTKPQQSDSEDIALYPWNVVITIAYHLMTNCHILREKNWKNSKFSSNSSFSYPGLHLGKIPKVLITSSLPGYLALFAFIKVLITNYYCFKAIETHVVPYQHKNTTFSSRNWLICTADFSCTNGRAKSSHQFEILGSMKDNCHLDTAYYPASMSS